MLFPSKKYILLIIWREKFVTNNWKKSSISNGKVTFLKKILTWHRTFFPEGGGCCGWVGSNHQIHDHKFWCHESFFMKFFEISFLKSHFENPYRGFLRKSEQKTPIGIFWWLIICMTIKIFPIGIFCSWQKNPIRNFMRTLSSWYFVPGNDVFTT